MDKKQIKVGIRLQKLQILKYSFEFPHNRDIDLNTVYFEFESKINFNQEKELIFILLAVKVFEKDNKKINIGNLSVLFEYHCLGFKNFKHKGNTVNIPNDLNRTLFNTSYSTLRGIFYEKTIGTYLQNFILPMIDIKKLIPKKPDVISSN